MNGIDTDGDGNDDAHDGDDTEHGNQMLDGPIRERFYKSWTWLLQNLGSQTVQISFCCRTQWKVTRPGLRSEREETPSSWMIFICITANGVRGAAANVGNAEIIQTVVTN